MLVLWVDGSGLSTLSRLALSWRPRTCLAQGLKDLGGPILFDTHDASWLLPYIFKQALPDPSQCRRERIHGRLFLVDHLLSPVEKIFATCPDRLPDHTLGVEHPIVSHNPLDNDAPYRPEKEHRFGI